MDDYDDIPDSMFEIPDEVINGSAVGGSTRATSSGAAAGLDHDGRHVDFDAPYIDDSNNGPSSKRVKIELKDTANIVKDPENDIDYKQWNRPKLPLNFGSSGLSFMQVDLDDYQDKPHPVFAESTNRLLSENERNLEAPILRMYGITREGHSVLAHIHGFLPYFYCPVGQCMDAKIFQDSLEQQLVNSRAATNIKKNVISVEVVERTNIMEWQENGVRSFFKVYVALQRLIQASRTSVENGFSLVGNAGTYSGFGTYETNIPFALRYLIDMSLTGCGWVDIVEGLYTVRPNDQKLGNAQIEIDVAYSNVKPGSESSLIAPLRILSFDIECWNQLGRGFPEPEKNPVIQIAAEVKEVGSKSENMDERDLLLSFTRFIVSTDADFLTGYNIINFDIPYLLKRANTLEIGGFAEFGRLQKIPARIREFTSPQGRPQKQISCDGRIIFDMYSVIAKEHNLRSYTLNFVSSHFLGDQKEDVHYSVIGTLHTGNAETRRRLAAYCLKDAKLPLRLLDKLCCLYNYVEMSRVTGTPVNFLLFRGQAIKVFGMILRKARTADYIVPAKKVEASEDKFEGATVLEPKTDMYQKPIATLDFASLYPSIMMAHNLCYCTLIPTNMIKGNRVLEPNQQQFQNQQQLGLQQTGDLNSNQLQFMNPEQYTQSPCGHFFVKPSRRKGLLPEILEELLGARKRAKKEMNIERDPFKKAVLNGRQLALKVSANSVYGFTGATVGMMPCLEISSSVTAFGRTMIEQTKNLVEEQYCKEKGYSHDAEVIYGDTDSVMVKFGPDTVKECMDLGMDAADRISKTFLNPIKLEFEKVYFPYLLLAKKRYAGLYWTNPDRFDKMDTKGIETVRRDNCGLVQKVVDTALRIILMDRNVDKAVKFIHEQISDLLQNKVDMSLLIISKSLGRGGAEAYAARQAHVELAERMKIRNPATAPGAGDRVPYVIVKSLKKNANYEKSEDPMYVLENGLSIDAQWYIEHQLSGPLLRIFDPIMNQASQKLFTGEHTRKIVSQGGGVLPGLNADEAGAQEQGSSQLVAKQTFLQCLGCKVKIGESNKASGPEGSLSLCKYCIKDKGPEIILEKLEATRGKQVEYQRLWTECQRCQDALHNEVICTNTDCPIFYKRAKARIELQKLEKQIKSLELEW